MNRRHMLTAGAALVLASPAILRAQTTAVEYRPNPRKLRIAGGPAVGNYQWAVSQQIIPRLGNSPPFTEGIEVVSTGGSLANFRALRDGQVDAGLMQVDVFRDATKRNPELRDRIVPMRDLYEELFQIVAGRQSNFATLEDLAKAKGTLGVGDESGGTAQTFRILLESIDAAGKKYGGISTSTDEGSYDTFTTLQGRTGRGRAVAFIEGAGSARSKTANEVSAENSGGRPGLIMLNVEDELFNAVKGEDGQPLYKVRRLKPRPNFYNHLLPEGGYVWGKAGVATLSVPCAIYVRAEYRQAIRGEILERFQRAVSSALPEILKRVNPFPLDA